MDFLLKFDILKIDFENKFIEVTDTGCDWTSEQEHLDECATQT
jgi:hypothetical protein